MLLEQFQICNRTLKNRIVMPAMITAHAEDGMVNQFHMTHYGIRSDMGVGMIILEATAVAENGRITMEDLGIWKDEQIFGYEMITDYLRKNKTISCLQLAHAGRKSHNDLRQVAPSAVPFKDGDPVPHELTIEEIEEIISDFGKAALRAKIARFDAVEIHAAHGYLINQFLSPLSNKRTDEFGGTKEKRFEFLRRVVKEVQKNFCNLIFVRVSADEYVEGGLTIDDHIEIAKELEQLGIHMMDISSGGVAPYNYDPKPGYQVHLSEKIKQNVSIPVTAVGLITEYEQAKEILESNQADLIQMGRELLRSPGKVLEFAKKEGVTLEVDYPYSRI